MNNRDAAMNRCIEELETDMELLGITGVEGKYHFLDVKICAIDKLQDDVAITVENLRSAGVQIWMLTGDKVETATCIALSAGFKSRSQEFFYIRDQTSVKQSEIELAKFQQKAEKRILMIDG